MATIARTRSGIWGAPVRRQGWPPQIKTFRLKRDAEDWARRTETDIARGTPRTPASEQVLLAMVLERYGREISPRKGASTRNREVARVKPLKHHLSPCLTCCKKDIAHSIGYDFSQGAGGAATAFMRYQTIRVLVSPGVGSSPKAS